MKTDHATIRRRTALAALGGALAAPLVARAQEAWPTRTVRYINPFPAGGATDTLSRLYCQKMTELTGQQFVVENRGGSGGDVGVDVVAKAAPDGYTIGLGGIASHAISPTLKKGQLTFDPEKDFTFVTNLWWLPNMLVANLDLPAKTVPELIALLKKNPGKYSYASAGNGTTLHLSGELFKQLAEVDMLHVPYRGAAPAMVDLMAGQVHMIFDNIPGALAQYRPGKVRGFAVTSLQRSAAAPDIPTLAEFLPGFDIRSWTCLVGPAKLPAPVVERMSAVSRKALESPDLIKAYIDLGATAWWSTPQDVTAYRASEEARLAAIIRKAGAKVD
ncbi:tripartite tricarboxylate transporter substrate binding protein [Vineibacter terrae]|uniref:Bug family tripartite tricarboxylate transporter substrate binding protein n=1 Tax=Vineibacter terrae TaxID=2586908 RepID=UPI002E33FBC3|nr:tripartite tricarboxylate transporter substrate binding protein [Vineibacter terrae]HEX2888248.1 tripartite tricarboxylate transporter substrate binding protein [Vineibacter terrae]